MNAKFYFTNRRLWHTLDSSRISPVKSQWCNTTILHTDKQSLFFKVFLFFFFRNKKKSVSFCSGFFFVVVWCCSVVVLFGLKNEMMMRLKQTVHCPIEININLYLMLYLIIRGKQTVCFSLWYDWNLHLIQFENSYNLEKVFFICLFKIKTKTIDERFLFFNGMLKIYLKSSNNFFDLI